MEYQMPPRAQNSNKATFGKVLNVSGSHNYIGAAYLSTKSILKVGAGVAALACEERVIDSVSKLLPEAIYMLRNEALKKIQKFTVMLIGCGLGAKRNSEKDFINFINLAEAEDIPTVIDADGLNILSKNKNITLPSQTIITPHPLEAARLLDVSADDIIENLEESAKKLSETYNCVSVLKSHRTIICDKQSIFINRHGNSALAKAGSGDVLAGIISGIVAQGTTLFEAAKLGVYLHSRSGEIASENLTEYSVLASDIINYLPVAIREIVK